jgi:D-methionine transport system ATP-binding protein
MALVELRNVHKTFPSHRRGGAAVEAIRGVDLDVAIVGYSGAGKSTLVRLVNALETATSGTVTVDGVELGRLSERELRRARLGIGMIFQQFNLMRSRTVWGNVEFPLRVAGLPSAERQRRISELLHFVGLADKAHAYVDQLSGGQRQRVGIARALATRPKLLLADEATSALDPDTTQEVLALLRKVNAELGVTVIVITHEMDVVRTLADKVAVMEDGRVVEQGTVAEVFSRPGEAVTRRFVATVVDEAPDAEELAALRTRYAGRLVSLRIEESTPQAKVFALLAEQGVGVEVVHGGINQVGTVSFGHLTLALDGEPAALATAVERLTGLAEVTEL